MAKILIVFSTTDGHTSDISAKIAEVLTQKGDEVTIHALAEGPVADLDSFEKIIIGASIRYGKHQPVVYKFIEENQQILETKDNAFFSVNVVARKPEKNQPDTNPYMIKFLKQISWQPKKLAVFAGRLDYPLYTYFDRQMIRLIMWMTKGPTAPDTVIEYTDWDAVKDFANEMAEN
jgi:menaquinone-dependent protoporphyrinogen oxidase